MSSEDGGHEQVDVEAEHVLARVAEERGHVLGHFFDAAALLDQVDVDDPLLLSDFVLALLQTPLQHLLTAHFSEFGFAGSINFQQTIEDKQGQTHDAVVLGGGGQLLQFLLDVHLDVEELLGLSLDLRHLHSRIGENLQKSRGLHQGGL